MRTYKFELCDITPHTSLLYSFTKVIKFIAYLKKLLYKNYNGKIDCCCNNNWCTAYYGDLINDILYSYICALWEMTNNTFWSLISRKLFEIAIVTSSFSYVLMVNHFIILHYVAICYIQVNVHSLNYINCQKFWLLLSG